MTKGSIGYSGKIGSPSGMYGAGKGYGSMGGSSKLTGGYGLEKCLGGMKGYGSNQNGSGMVYAVIGIGYSGNSKEMARGLQQYLQVLGQYLTSLSKGYGNKTLGYSNLMSDKEAYKPLDNKTEDKHSTCEICGAPTFKGIRRCEVCSSLVGKY